MKNTNSSTNIMKNRKTMTEIEKMKPMAKFIHLDRLRYPRLSDARYYEKTSLHTFLTRIFNEEDIIRVFKKYEILVANTLMHDGLYGVAVPFKDDRTHQVVEISYDVNTGEVLEKRFVGELLMKGYDLRSVLCLFGAHLLPKHPEKPVGIVKTIRDAIVMTLDDNSKVWLAVEDCVDGKWSFSDPSVLNSLKGRDVALYFTHEFYEEAMLLAKEMKLNGIDANIYDMVSGLRIYTSYKIRIINYPIDHIMRGVRDELLLYKEGDDLHFANIPYDISNETDYLFYNNMKDKINEGMKAQKNSNSTNSPNKASNDTACARHIPLKDESNKDLEAQYETCCDSINSPDKVSNDVDSSPCSITKEESDEFWESQYENNLNFPNSDDEASREEFAQRFDEHCCKIKHNKVP